MEEIITGGKPVADSFQAMRAKLEESIELTAQKRVSYSISMYPGSADVPSVVTCFAGCTSEAVATELLARIAELVRSYFPTASKGSVGQA
jgi:hypothetical protein